MKKAMGKIGLLALCAVLFFAACAKKDTPFAQANASLDALEDGASPPFSSASTVPAPENGTSAVQAPENSASTDAAVPASPASPQDAVPSPEASPPAPSASSSGTSPGASPQEPPASSFAQASETADGSRGATVDADGGLRLRDSAGESGEKLLTIPTGTHIVCTGWQDGWVKTSYEGQAGYVSAAYLLFDGKVSADGGLRLRSGPGESYEKLLTIPDGTALVCTGQEDGWVKTTYDGTAGYVSQDYLMVAATVNAGPGLNLRETASEAGAKLVTIPNGAPVQCCGNPQGDWAKVKYKEYEGYVSRQYLAFD